MLGSAGIGPEPRADTLETDLRLVDRTGTSSRVGASEADPDRHYVGITGNLPERVRRHNSGPGGHTESGRLWSVLVSIEFRTERDARRFETYLNTGSGRAFAKRHLAPSA